MFIWERWLSDLYSAYYRYYEWIPVPRSSAAVGMVAKPNPKPCPAWKRKPEYG